MKIPEARERAERESLDILVDFGRVCFRRRRMQAAGGSKSAELELLFEVVVDVNVEVLLVDDGLVAAAAVDGCSVVVVAAATAVG